MKDILSVQRQMRAKGEIIILNGNEMYNVPIVTVCKTFLRYNVSGGHLRYGTIELRYGYCRYGL